VGAGASGPHERPDLFDAVDLEVAGVLDLRALEGVQWIDVDAELSASSRSARFPERPT
jgi:hypothetical protein